MPISVAFFWAVYLASISIGLARGFAPERLGASILLALPLVQYSGYLFLPVRYSAVDPVSITVDLIGVIGFGYLALNARRVWPIVACSLQMLALSSHFARSLEISGHPVIYAWMKSTPTLFAALCVAAGTLWQHRTGEPGLARADWVDWASLRASR